MAERATKPPRRRPEARGWSPASEGRDRRAGGRRPEAHTPPARARSCPEPPASPWDPGTRRAVRRSCVPAIQPRREPKQPSWVQGPLRRAMQDPPHTVSEGSTHVLSHPQGEPRLPGASRPHEGQKTNPPEKSIYLRKLPLAPDEAGRLKRQVAPRRLRPIAMPPGDESQRVLRSCPHLRHDRYQLTQRESIIRWRSTQGTYE